MCMNTPRLQKYVMKRSSAWRLFIVFIALGIFRCGAGLEWHGGNGYKWAELAVPREGKPGFTLLTPEQTGITFTNPLDEHAIATNRMLANGCGVAIGDYDQTGWRTFSFAAWTGAARCTRTWGG